MKKQNRRLPLGEVPVVARDLFGLKNKQTHAGGGKTWAHLDGGRGQTAGQRQHLPRGQAFEPVVAPQLPPPS